MKNNNSQNRNIKVKNYALRLRFEAVPGASERCSYTHCNLKIFRIELKKLESLAGPRFTAREISVLTPLPRLSVYELAELTKKALMSQ